MNMMLYNTSTCFINNIIRKYPIDQMIIQSNKCKKKNCKKIVKKKKDDVTCSDGRKRTSLVSLSPSGIMGM